MATSKVGPKIPFDEATIILQCLKPTMIRRDPVTKRLTIDSRTFFSAMRVCKAWKEYCEQLLYTVALDPKQLINFDRSSSNGRKQTRSLTIYLAPVDHRKQESRGIEHMRIFDPQGTQIVRAIELIPAIVLKMTKLESFSFVAPLIGDRHAFPTPTGPNTGLIQETLSGILHKLPKTVKHLEIDVMNTHSQSLHQMSTEFCGLAHPDLCTQLYLKLPALANLRLRTPCICARLFTGGALCGNMGDERRNSREPVLQQEGRTIIINTVDYCFDGKNDSASRWEHPFMMAMWDRNFIELVDAGVAAANSGNLGTLGRLSFFGVKNRPTRAVIYPAINKCAVVPHRTRLRYPYSEVRTLDYDLDQTGFLRYRAANGRVAEAWGGWCDLMTLAEDEVWVQTTEGYRVPATYLRANPRFEHVVLQAKSLFSEEKIQRRRRGVLFQKEERAGQKLLVVHESNNLRDLGCVARQFTRGEATQLLPNGVHPVLNSALLDDYGDPMVEPQVYLSEDMDEDFPPTEDDRQMQDELYPESREDYLGNSQHRIEH